MTKVDKWIEENFDTTQITIQNHPIVAEGRLIIDKEGKKILVFRDLIINKVVYCFENEEGRHVVYE